MAKKEEKEERSTFSAIKLFNITDKRADEILHEWKHAKLDEDTWQGVWRLTVKNAKVKGEGEFAYMGYMFGRMYEQHNNPLEDIKDLLDLLGKAKGIAINGNDLPEDIKKHLIDHLSGKHNH